VTKVLVQEESYLHARQLFLSNESFQQWPVDDQDTSEMFLLNIATPATLEGRQTVSTALSFGKLSEGQETDNRR
jgi:hypothetical protein